MMQEQTLRDKRTIYTGKEVDLIMGMNLVPFGDHYFNLLGN